MKKYHVPARVPWFLGLTALFLLLQELVAQGQRFIPYPTGRVLFTAPSTPVLERSHYIASSPGWSYYDRGSFLVQSHRPFSSFRFSSVDLICRDCLPPSWYSPSHHGMILSASMASARSCEITKKMTNTKLAPPRISFTKLVTFMEPSPMWDYHAKTLFQECLLSIIPILLQNQVRVSNKITLIIFSNSPTTPRTQKYHPPFVPSEELIA